MSDLQRIMRIEAKLKTLHNLGLDVEFKLILDLSGTKFYLALNQFEKKLGVSNDTSK